MFTVQTDEPVSDTFRALQSIADRLETVEYIKTGIEVINARLVTQAATDVKAALYGQIQDEIEECRELLINL